MPPRSPEINRYFVKRSRLNPKRNIFNKKHKGPYGPIWAPTRTTDAVALAGVGVAVADHIVVAVAVVGVGVVFVWFLNRIQSKV